MVTQPLPGGPGPSTSSALTVHLPCGQDGCSSSHHASRPARGRGREREACVHHVTLLEVACTTLAYNVLLDIGPVALGACQSQWKLGNGS